MLLIFAMKSQIAMEKVYKADSKQIKKIKEALQSSNKEKILEGIKLSRVDGTQETFTMMLNCLKETDEPEVETAVIAFLYDLKDESSVAPLIAALEDEEMKYYHSFLIAAFWQSALDGSAYLELFVKKAIEGEYMTSLEALTVIENFDSSFPQDTLMDCEADLLEAIDNELEEEKKNLLISLKEVISKLPQEGE